MAGSIKEISNKYRVTFEYGKDSNGKRIREYKTFDTQKEAKKALNDFEYGLQRNLAIQQNQMRVAQLMEYWLENDTKYNCTETTIYGYRNIIKRHIVPFLGDTEVQKLSTPQVQKYYKHILDEKNLSPNTVHKHHAVISKALGFALKQQIVSRNVAKDVSLPKKNTYKAKYYTQEQLANLLEMVKGTTLEVPISLAGYLGLRREEVVGLRWEYINLENRELYIEEIRTSAGKYDVVGPPKTDGSRRRLYIIDELYDVLVSHRNKQLKYKKLLGKEYTDSGYVIAKDNGKLYKVNWLTERFKRFLQEKQLPMIRLHDLRHTFCSILYDEGVDIVSISEALGHSNLSTTTHIYKHKFDKTHKTTVIAMGSALKK